MNFTQKQNPLFCIQDYGYGGSDYTNYGGNRQGRGMGKGTQNTNSSFIHSHFAAHSGRLTDSVWSYLCLFWFRLVWSSNFCVRIPVIISFHFISEILSTQQEKTKQFFTQHICAVDVLNQSITLSVCLLIACLFVFT